MSRNCSLIDVGNDLFSIPHDIDNMNYEDSTFFPYTQGKTGYCWLEATLQYISIYSINKYGKHYFFDDCYLMFFDKLEKASLFFENIIKEINNPIFGRENSFILSNAMTDKGQWHMARNLIQKYGLALCDCDERNIAPKTTELNIYISYILRKKAFEMRDAYKKGLSLSEIYKFKDEALQSIFNILVSFYGNQYENSISKKYQGLTPKGLFNKKIKFPFDEYVSIYPTQRKQMIETEILFDGNVSECSGNEFLGVSDEQFQKLLERHLNENNFCWCSGDFGKFYIKSLKLLDDFCFSKNATIFENFNINGMNRSDIIDYHLAHLSHAFVLTGSNGNDSYCAYDSAYDAMSGNICRISDSWVSKYLLQAVVLKKYIDNYEKVSHEKESPWDFFKL